MDEVAVLVTGPEPAAFTSEPIGFRLVQRPIVAPAIPPSPEVVEVEVVQVVEVEVEPPPAPYYYATDEDDQDEGADQDDDVVVRRAPRVDPRLTDPDTLERAKRVEVYRAMIEEDPKASIFGRTNSPPRRVLPPPKTL